MKNEIWQAIGAIGTTLMAIATFWTIWQNSRRWRKQEAPRFHCALEKDSKKNVIIAIYNLSPAPVSVRLKIVQHINLYINGFDHFLDTLPQTLYSIGPNNRLDIPLDCSFDHRNHEEGYFEVSITVEFPKMRKKKRQQTYHLDMDTVKYIHPRHIDNKALKQET
ncbi:MAG: hypothetical protein NC396_06250 [Bacteroides sp.]|nr:hypothetical protein [Bacteroides sp.]MCM1085957.1 hypothetical protein [Bacteroides sp.]